MKDQSRQLLRFAFIILIVVAIVKLLTAADPIALKVQGPDTNGNALQAITVAASQANALQTQVTASNSAAAGAASASLAGVVGKTNVVSGCYYSVGGATAGTVSTYTLSGIVGGSISWQVAIPAGVNTESAFSTITFNPPLIATGTNTAITLANTSPGAGNVANSVALWGYQQ